MSHFRVFGYPTWENISSKGCKAPSPRPYTFIGYEDNVKAYRLMDPETHEIFVEKDVHFEESSPSLSSNPLYTSYIVETDSDTSDSASIDSDKWGSIDSSNERSHHQSTPHAYIATVKGPDNLDDLHLLSNGDDPSTIVVRVHSNPHVHSLHD